MKKLILLFLLAPFLSFTQIAAWDFAGETALATSTPEVYDVNLDSPSELTRGPGAAASAGANSFRTVGFMNDGIATTNLDYFQNELSSSPGYELSLSSIDGRFGGTATFFGTPGVTVQYAYSLDGSNFTLIGSPEIAPVSASSIPTIDLTGIAELQNVPASTTITIRMYASGNTATGGFGYLSTAAPGVIGFAIGGSLNFVSSTCLISDAGLSNISCNDNTTPSVTNDDFISFNIDPTGFNLGTTYTVAVSSGTISPTTGTYGASSVFQLQPGSSGGGDVILTITDNTTGGCTFDATITDPGSCSSSTPLITANPTSLTGLDHNVGTPSAEQTFTVAGLALIDDITLTAPADAEISLTTGSGFTNSVVVPQVGGIATATTIYVRGNAAMMGNFSGAIIASSTNAVDVEINVSGFADDYVYYTIDQISTVDANGVSDSLDVLVEVTGVVHCMDFDGNAGYSITLIDASEEGINLYSPVDISNYTSPMEGDSIRVYGKIGQYNGLTEVIADEIELLAQNVALFDPVLVTALDESTESQYIMMQGMTLVTPITNFAAGSSNVDITDGTNTFVMRIDSDTDIPGSAAPQGFFTVIGVGGQFDNSSPYDGGYQIFPCSISSIIFECTTPSNATTLVDESTASADASGLSYQWINCATGLPIANAIQQSFTATTTGSYAVIVTDTDCSDTSDCISLTVCSNPIATTTLVNDSTATADAIGVQYQWIDCSTGLAIANENQQTFTATASGSYAVVVSEGACSDTSECVNLTLSVGIEEMLNTNSIKVYPNPIVDELSITSSSDFSISFSVADINGKVISENNILHSSATINTSKWSKGVYFVKFTSEKGEFIVKVMK